MSYDVATTGLLEDALSEAFKYHNELDSFVLRAGLSQSALADARSRAEERSNASTRGFGKAPKRFVAQEILKFLDASGESGGGVLASMVTGFCKGTFLNASPDGTAAVEGLKARIGSDRAEREKERAARASEDREKEERVRRRRDAELASVRRERDDLHQRFLSLMAEANAQRRGYLLEPFMNDFFEFEGLDPRRSFKIVGEQIDGSMIWRDRSNLVEVKWVSSPVAGREFGAFTFKIEGKSADTRGLFISINGYSSQAIQALNGKGALKFVCLDGTHVMRALSPGQSLKDVLEKAWRHADETGEAYLPANRM